MKPNSISKLHLLWQMSGDEIIKINDVRMNITHLGRVIAEKQKRAFLSEPIGSENPHTHPGLFVKREIKF